MDGNDFSATVKPRAPAPVERARAAREERARAAAAATAAAVTTRHIAAAGALQRAARQWLGRVRLRAVLRAAWACPSEPPPAGQQLALVGWLLRFYEPERDVESLSELCKLLLAGLAGGRPDRMFCAAALTRGLTRRWVELHHRLLLACARQLRHRPAPGGASGTPRLASLGAPLRLLLVLAEPDAWAFTRQLAAEPDSAPTAAALQLMAATTFAAAAPTIVRSVGALFREHSPPLERPLVGAAATVAVLAVLATCAGGGGPPALETVRHLVFGVLALPGLCEPAASALPDAALGRMLRDDALW